MSKIEAYLSPYGMITVEATRDWWTVTLDLKGRNVGDPCGRPGRPMTEICAVLEHTDTTLATLATLHEHSGELLSELLDIARRQSTLPAVCAVLLVSQQEELPDISLLPTLGIHRLYILEHPDLAHYSTESYVEA